MSTYIVISEEVGVEDGVRHTVQVHASSHSDALDRTKEIIRPTSMFGLYWIPVIIVVGMAVAGTIIYQWAWSLK